MKKAATLTMLGLLAVTVQANTTTLIVHNHVTSAPPEKIFLQFFFRGAADLEPLVMTNNLHVVRPFTVSSQTWTLMIHNVNSGNLRFGHDPDNLVQNGVETGYEVLFDGFVEFTVLTGDPAGWWNLSNVDWIGMLCGLRCTRGGKDPGTNWSLGYGRKASELIDMISQQYEFTPAETAQVMKPFPAGTKLMAPTKYPNTYSGSAGGQRSVATYFNRLVSNQVPAILVADRKNADGNPAPNPPDWDNRVGPLAEVEFGGGFRAHANLQSLGINDAPVVYVLTNHAVGVELYLTANALNANTILSGDSYGGCWVRYQSDLLNPGSWGWVITNEHLNCVRIEPGSNSAFRAWCASLTKKVIYPINAGIIPTNAHPGAGQVFNYSGFASRLWETNTWQRPRYQINMYNHTIVTNSDSYGMSYSDAGDSSKVQAQTYSAQAPIVELHLLDPQADPSAYYSKATPGPTPTPTPTPTPPPSRYTNWAQAHGLAPATNPDDAPSANRDGDPDSNWEEFVADTDPLDATKYFRNEITNVTGHGTLLLYAGPPTTNTRLYDVWRATNLTHPAWQALDFDQAGAGDGAAVPFWVTNFMGKCYYRTGVKVPPAE